MYQLGGLSAESRRLKTVPPTAFNRVGRNLIEGRMDVPSGSVRSSPAGGSRGRDEASARRRGCSGCTGTRCARCSGTRCLPGTVECDNRVDRSWTPYKGVIDRIVEDDWSLPKKQRHTAKRIYDRLRDEHGFPGKYTIVKDYVRERRRQTREMFVPLSHPPGQAQCDYGEARVIIGGVEQKAHYFALDLPHSDGCFVKAYPAETTESFCDGHVSGLRVPGQSTSEHRVRQHQACGAGDILGGIFSGLVKLDTDLQVVADMAESWEVSDNNTVFTFTLRDNARFHDGRAVMAADVKYSWERALHPDLESPVAHTYLGDIVGAQAMVDGEAETLEGVEVLDDRTLRVTITDPFSYFLSKLTYPTSFVVDRANVEIARGLDGRPQRHRGIQVEGVGEGPASYLGAQRGLARRRSRIGPCGVPDICWQPDADV